MSEKNLKNQVLKMVKKEFPGAWTWKISDRYYSGIPDLLILFMELKFGKNTLEDIQKYTIKEIKNRGVVAEEVRSVSQAKEILTNTFGKGGN